MCCETVESSADRRVCALAGSIPWSSRWRILVAIADPVGLFGAIASGIRLDGDLVEPAKAWSSLDGIVCSGRGEGGEVVMGGSFTPRRWL